MGPLIATSFLLAEAVVVAALSGRQRGARLAFALAVLLLPWPWFVEAHAFWRSAFALGACWCVIRSADFMLEVPPTSFGHRLLHLFALIDTRLVRRESHAVPARWWGLLLLAVAAALAGLVAVRGAAQFEGAAHYVVRWGWGILVVLAGFEAVTVTYRIAAAALGLYAPRLSHYPLLAQSVAEFWSARWNRVVGKVLRDRVFVPLAHRGPAFAIWATFAVSAVFHAYLTGVVLHAWGPALSAGVFFLLQPPLLAAERALRLRRRPRIVRHAWTLAALLLPSPLFIEPVLRMLGLEPS